MEKKKKSLAINAVLNTIKTVASMLLSIFTFPYVTRALGAEVLGKYNFSYSIVSYATLIAGLGIMSYAIREGSQYRTDNKKMENFISEVFSISVISTIIAYIGLFLVVWLSPNLNEYRGMIAIISTEIICATLGVSWISNIYEDFAYITARTLGFQILYIVLLFIFVHEPSDVYKYIIILTFTNSGANILNYFYLRKKYVRFRFTFNCNWRRHIKPILVIFSTKIAMTIYVNSDKTILGLLTTDVEVGLYSAAVKIYTIVKEILIAMITVLIPRFAIILRQNNNKKEADKFFSKVFTTLSLLLFPATVGLFIIAPEVMFVMCGAEYLAAGNTLRILSLAILFSLYANIYLNCVLLPSRKETVGFYATLVSAFANVVLNFILIPLMGINAAALTTLIAEIIMFAVCIYSSRKIIRLVGVRKDIFSIIISTISVVGICYGFKFILSNMYVRLVCSIVFSVIVYIILLVALKNSIVYGVLNSIKQKIRKKMVQL